MTEDAENPHRMPQHPTDDRRERRLLAMMVMLFGVMSALAALDATMDVRDKIALVHAIVEESIFVLGLVGMLMMGWWLLRSMRRERQLTGEAERLTEQLVETEQVLRAEAQELAVRLAETEQEAARWKLEAGGLLAGLGEAIDAQFARWGLSPAEREIGILLLKGLSHKEIAQVRHVSEATVRQQAQRLYRKANIGSRNDLAAFFLEDLLLPSSRGTVPLTDGEAHAETRTERERAVPSL